MSHRAHVSLASYTVTDHLDHDWLDELVGFALPAGLDPASPIAIVDERDNVIASQVSRLGGAMGSGAAGITGESRPWRVFFHIDRLPKLGTRAFRLVAAERAADEITHRGGASNTVEWSNGILSLRVPASQSLSDRHNVPGPVLGVRLGDGPWLGASRLVLGDPIVVDRIDTRVLESGPLWLRAAVTYCHGERALYRVVFRLLARRSHAEVVEDSWFNHAAHWDFELGATPADGKPFDLAYTHAHQVSPDRPAREFEVPRGARKNLGAITLPNYGGIYVPDDYQWFTLARSGGEHVSVAGIHGGAWHYPAENQIEINGSSQSLAFNFPCKAGHREWCIGVETNRADWKNAWASLVAQRVVRQYDTPLDTVKEWTLTWDEHATARPRVALGDDELPMLRANAARIPSLRKYVESLEPALDGEWFRYHSGTWGDQDPLSKSDPPTAFLVTGDRRAAMKTKEMILAGLRHRIEGFLSPTSQLSPSVGSYINLGRGLRPWVQFYDMVAKEGVFTDAEDRWFRAVCAFFAYKVADRDYFPREALLFHSDHPRSIHRTHWYPNRESDYTYHNIDNLPHNFHMELYGSAIVVALAFPNHPLSAAWVEESVELLDRELTDFVFPCGAWIESATYTFYALSALLVPPMIALRRAGVRDYFSDERFKRIFDFLAKLITAPDPRVGHGAFPVLGDAGFPGYYAYVFNWVATLTNPTDPSFASRMMDAWVRYGRQISPPQCQGLNYLDLLLVNDWVPPIAPPRLESQDLQGLGALLLRSQGASDETYFIIKCGRIYSHFHGDEGAFILNAKGVPLMDEYGIQYGAGTMEQRRHNIVEFKGREVYNRGRVTTFRSGAMGDYIVCEMPIHVLYGAEGLSQWGFKGEEGPFGWWRRYILFAKPSDVFAIYDQIESPYDTTLHHHFKADRYELLGANRWRFHGRFGVDASLLLLAERELAHTMEEFDPKDRNPGQSADSGWFRQWSVNVPGKPDEHFASLIVPHRPHERVALERVAGMTASRVDFAAGNSSFKQWTFLAPAPTSHRVDDLVYEGRGGVIKRDGDRVTLTQMAGRLIGVEDVVIEGDGPFEATVTHDEVCVNLPDATRMVKVSASGKRVMSASVYSDRLSKTADGRVLIRGG